MEPTDNMLRYFDYVYRNKLEGYLYLGSRGWEVCTFKPNGDFVSLYTDKTLTEALDRFFCDLGQ